jgi:hypothetical protein
MERRFPKFSDKNETEIEELQRHREVEDQSTKESSERNPGSFKSLTNGKEIPKVFRQKRDRDPEVVGTPKREGSNNQRAKAEFKLKFSRKVFQKQKRER